MSTRTASWQAWSLAGLCVAMFLASVVLYVLAHSSQEPISTGGALSELLIFLSFLAFPIVGALDFYWRSRQPGLHKCRSCFNGLTAPKDPRGPESLFFGYNDVWGAFEGTSVGR
jgi:hypothetical protein